MTLNLMGGDVLADEQSDPHFMARKLTRMVMRRADVVHVKSDFLGEAAQSVGVQASSIQKLFWGIDRQVFISGPKTREHLGLSPSRFIIFSPRPLSGFYRIDQVVQALPQLIETGVDPELVVSEYEADPDFLSALRQLVRDINLDDRVNFRAPMDKQQMADMYRSANVCIGIPPSDAFPQTVLEAMACDCVNVMTNLPRYQEFVRDGESVLFTEPSSDAIAQVISDLAQDDDLRAHLVAGGRAVLDKLPTLDESATQLISELGKLPVSTSGKIPGWVDRASGRVALAALSRRFSSQEQ
jgi:glycosyltransferase involved in cell wall biosynthesis